MLCGGLGPHPSGSQGRVCKRWGEVGGDGHLHKQLLGDVRPDASFPRSHPCGHCRDRTQRPESSGWVRGAHAPMQVPLPSRGGPGRGRACDESGVSNAGERSEDTATEMRAFPVFRRGFCGVSSSFGSVNFQP